MSPKIKSTLIEIETQWSYEDLVDAHMLLDVFEEAEYRAQQRVK